ncbi:hypothetical protein [Bryobacter aggregatus]|uniref:hypothetical protein n=1 Tax=Bryobacter aggregatus TaxID=360054 RepID=UPI0012BAAFE6|nr:hypothetical protein [Bryobacter aggregatus]
MLLSIFSVLAGYLIFAVSAFWLFRLAGQAPHQQAPLGFMIGSSVCGCLFAGLGGYMAGMWAGRAPLGHGVAVGIVLAIGASVSLANTMGSGAIWSQVAAILLMAPSAMMGGWLRMRQVAGRA